MKNVKNITTFSCTGFGICLLVGFLLISGCKAVKKTSEFLESLRNPTTFSETFVSSVENTDNIVKEHSLSEGRNVKVVPIGKNKTSSVHLILLRKDAEIDAHFHKSHDLVFYFKKGTGIVEVEGTRTSIKDGMMVFIPAKSAHRYVNTGDEVNVVIAVFTPPFDGNDIKMLNIVKAVKKKKRTIYDKGIKEKKAESGEKGRWITFWKGEEEKIDIEDKDAAQIDEAAEEQDLLVLSEEDKQKIKEVQQKINEEEKKMIERMIINEKLKTLQRLRNEGLLTGEEFNTKRAELIKHSKK